MKARMALFLSLALVISTSAMAAARYWVGPVVGGNWNTTSNWSATSGGAAGATVPVSTDDVYLDRSTTGSCTLVANVTVNALYLTGFTSIINIGTNTLTINSAANLITGAISGTGSLTFNNTSTITFQGTTFSVTITGSASNIFFNGSVFNNSVTLTKTGLGINNGNGGNTFNGAVSLTNNYSGINPNELLLGTINPDIFNGDVTINTSYFGNITLGAKSLGNQFNGNIIFANTSTACTISIGTTTASCSSTLASGKTLSNGMFLGGNLKLYGLTQSGNTAQALNLSSGNKSRLIIGSAGFGCTFNGPVNFSTDIFEINASTFKNTSSFIQASNGGGYGPGGTSAGGNTFDGNVTFQNSGLLTLSLASTTGDIFNADVTYKKGVPSVSFLPLGLGVINIYKGNMVLYTNGTFAFSGKVLFTGATNQTISDPLSFSAPFAFSEITVNKSGGVLNQNVPITISTSLTLTSGVVKVNPSMFFTNYINFLNGATASAASNVSHVDGPVRKTGNTAFTFPVGNGGIARNISISAPASATDVFTAQFFRSSQAYGTAKDATLATLSNCEYWTLNRTTGTSNVNVTLSWYTLECKSIQSKYINTLADLRVSRWNGSQWVDHGNGATTGTVASGTVTSSTAITSFSPFALASSTISNPLPIVLKDFQASLIDHSVKLVWKTASEINNDHFTIERSENGEDFYEMTKVKGAGNKNTATRYIYWDEQAAAGISYYRLKQTDFDGTTTLLGLRTIEYSEGIPTLILYPNPVASTEMIHTNYSGTAKIFSLTGQEMFTIDNANEVVLPQLASGIYILQAAGGMTTKFVVK